MFFLFKGFIFILLFIFIGVARSNWTPFNTKKESQMNGTLTRIVYFLASFLLSWLFIFSGPEYFFSYFIYRFQGIFFIADANILASLFIQRITFLSWCLFFPIILISIYYSICSSFTKLEISWVKGILSSFMIAHVGAFVINEYDLSYIPIELNSSAVNGGYFSIERTDFSSYINQYIGFYWDLFYCIFAYLCYWILFIEVGSFYKLIIDEKSRVIFSWVYRLVMFSLLYYFFGGDNETSNIYFILFIFIRIEISIALQRLLVYLRMYKGTHSLTYVKP